MYFRVYNTDGIFRGLCFGIELDFIRLWKFEIGWNWAHMCVLKLAFLSSEIEAFTILDLEFFGFYLTLFWFSPGSVFISMEHFESTDLNEKDN